jgi:hypothetical protein
MEKLNDGECDLGQDDNHRSCYRQPFENGHPANDEGKDLLGTRCLGKKSRPNILDVSINSHIRETKLVLLLERT